MEAALRARPGRGYAFTVAWDPAQYLKFADQRLRPAVDLLSRVDAAGPGEVCDLGAGVGNVTRLFKARWRNARVTGVRIDRAKALSALSVPRELGGGLPRRTPVCRRHPAGEGERHARAIDRPLAPRILLWPGRAVRDRP